MVCHVDRHRLFGARCHTPWIAWAEAIASAIERSTPRLISAANLVEAAIVIEARKGEAGGHELDLLLYRGRIEVLPVD
jgi:ribonuclease VapC